MLVCLYLQVQASDQDQKNPYNLVTYEMVGDDPAKEYFQINALTGEIAVKKSLQLDSQQRPQYTVSALNLLEIN